MSKITLTRPASHTETIAEMVRRGKVIEQLEEDLRQTKIHLRDAVQRNAALCRYIEELETDLAELRASSENPSTGERST